MPLDNFEIAVGYNNSAGAVNIETLLKYPPRSVRLPIGSLTRTALSGAERTDGAQLIAWRWGGARFLRLDDYITTIFGDYVTQNAEVTIRTRLRDNTFDYFNAIAYLPLDGTDYTHVVNGLVRELQLRFRILGEAI